MLMKRKKTVLYFITALTCLIIFIKALENKKAVNPGIVSHFNLDNQTLNDLKTKEDLISWLENEEKSVWNELEKKINLSFEKCQKLKKNNRHEYNEDLVLVRNEYISKEPLTAETISCIQSIMQDFSINPSQLAIVGCHHGSAAAATDEFIMVDEKPFNALTLKAKKFVIGHELIHYLQQDHSTNFFVRKFSKRCNLDEKSENNPVNKLFRLQELRADILSSLQGDDYAQGNIIFFNDHIKAQGGLSGPPCHPTSSLRLELGTKIAGILSDKSQQA